MVLYENDCCACAAPGYPCDGSHKSVAHYYCDGCWREVGAGELSPFAEVMLCGECWDEAVEAMNREVSEAIFEARKMRG